MLIISVLLFGAAGFFYVSSQKKESVVYKITDSIPTPGSANESNSRIKTEITPPFPTEVILAAMIPLTIDFPKDGSTITSPKIQLTGKTVPRGEVFVNDAGTKADARGIFKVNLTLDEGDNYILVFANDEDGNYAQQEMTVTYEVK